MDLVVPEVQKAPRSLRSKVGHFVDDLGYNGFGHFLRAYRAGMAQLPDFDSQTDVATSLGSVRVYRFDGPATATPVLLLPGRSASTPMWRANLAPILQRRTVYSVDSLGEAGLSVQQKPITGADDQARWIDETTAALGLTRVHVVGASIGGWNAVNWAVRRPGRVASLTLLDPVLTFARIPLQTLLFSAAMVSPGVPHRTRQMFLRWVSGGAAVDDSVQEARLIGAATTDFVLRLPPPKLITDEQLRCLDVPVLGFIGGRSVMHNAEKAAQRARNLLSYGQIEVYLDGSHAINGEYADEIAERSRRFWEELCGRSIHPVTNRLQQRLRLPTDFPNDVVGRCRLGPVTCSLHANSGACAAALPIRSRGTAMNETGPIRGGRLIVTPRRDGETLLMHVAGDLDLLTAPASGTHLDVALADAPTVLIVDITELEFLSSGGIGLLVETHRLTGRAGISLRVVADGPATSRPIQRMRIDEIIDLYPTVAEAIRGR